MLRSSVQLYDLLQTPPTATLQSSEAELASRTKWSPQKKFRPGKPNRVHMTGPERNISIVKRNEPSVTSANALGSPFVYERNLSKLDETKSIRLLNILPGRKDDPLSCELQYVSLDNVPEYKAISYCWGDSTSSTTISCDGKALNITQNLAAALQSLRREEVSTLVWADAVCIQQTSVDEKNYQVPLMRQIYAKAADVQVWLGADTIRGSYREAFELLKLLCRAYHTLGWDFDVLAQRDLSKSELIQSCDLPATDDPSWDSLTELTQNQWFTRTWIVQEIVVSRHAVVRCGDATISWDQFNIGFSFAFKAGYLIYRPDVMWLASSYQNIVSLLTTQSQFGAANGSGLDLLSVLESYRSARASDPIDKVYGLLGLAPKIGKSQYTVEIDYSQTPAEVYIGITKLILTEGEYLDILGVPVAPSDELIGKLPSWVPNWNVPHVTSPVCMTNDDSSYAFDFNATKGARSKQVDFSGNTLILQGHVVDDITQLGDIMDPVCKIRSKNPEKSKLTLPQAGIVWSMFYVLIVLGNWLLMCKESDLIYKSEDITTIFFRTLLYDDFSHGYTLDAIQADYSKGLIRGLLFIYRRLLHASEFCVRNGLHIRNLHGYIRGTPDFKENLPYVDVIARTIGRRMIVTTNGYLGLVPAITEKGDHIVLVEGARTPLVMRQVNGDEWGLLGDCYVHGAMQGELFDVSKSTEIRIV